MSAIMLQKHPVVVKLEKLYNVIVPTAMAHPTNAVFYEEQLLGKLQQQLTKLYKV